MQCVDTPESKDTNPKDAVGATKLPIGLVPSTGINLAAVAFLEGAMKYGRYNWRAAGVQASIYYDAAMRHLEKYWNGEECDLKTGVPHLASAIASIMIIADAKVCGKLTDDRPPKAEIDKQIRDLEVIARLVREQFASHKPHQWTINDDPTPQLGSRLVGVTGSATDPAINIMRWPTQPGQFVPTTFGTWEEK